LTDFQGGKQKSLNLIIPVGVSLLIVEMLVYTGINQENSIKIQRALVP
jgi:hypothetical protein